MFRYFLHSQLFMFDFFCVFCVCLKSTLNMLCNLFDMFHLYNNNHIRIDRDVHVKPKKSHYLHGKWIETDSMLIEHKAYLIDGSIDKSNTNKNLYYKTTQKRKRGKNSNNTPTYWRHNTTTMKEHRTQSHSLKTVELIASKLKVKVTLCAFHFDQASLSLLFDLDSLVFVIGCADEW